MANFIQSLQAEVAEEKRINTAAQDAITAFSTFLMSAKFTGTENGERKDWIATGDVQKWLGELRSTLQGA